MARALTLAALAALPLVSASETPKTIFSVIEGSANHQKLAELIKANGLNETLSGGSFTVFAPQDGAFEDVDLSEDVAADAATAQLLLHHVIDGNTPLTTSRTLSKAGATLNIVKDADDDTLTINSAIVSAPAEDVTNGLLYTNVLVDDAAATAATAATVPELKADDLFAIITAEGDAAESKFKVETFAKIFNLLSDDDNFKAIAGGDVSATIFVPTDEAFEALNVTLPEEAADFDKSLMDTLLRHVILGSKVLSSEITDKQTAGDLTFGKTDAGVTINTDAKVIAVDYASLTYAIHVVDTVIPEPKETGDDDDEDAASSVMVSVSAVIVACMAAMAM